MKYIIIAVLICICSKTSAQQYKKSVEELKVASELKLLAGIDSFFIKRAERFAVSFFIISNGSGSADLPDGHEISHSILISVAEYDEYPVNRVFKIGPFYKPGFIGGRDEKEHYTIVVEHGAFNKRQKTTLMISKDGVHYK